VRWERCLAGQGAFPPHWHELNEFHLVTQGGVKCLLQGKLYLLDRNSLLRIRPRKVHQFLSYPAASERLSLFVDLGWIGEAGRLGRSVSPHIRLTAREATLVTSLLRRAQQETEWEMPLWRELVRQLLSEFVLLLRRAALRPAVAPVAVPSLMGGLIEHLDTHYMAPLTLADLGRHFGYSPFYLSHQFSRFFGLGIKHYVLQRRIIEAQLLMTRNPGLTLAAVAEQVGFKEYAVFHRGFLKITGLSPVQHRKKVHPLCK
jgi:AraC-like DNA-binding protein